MQKLARPNLGQEQSSRNGKMSCSTRFGSRAESRIGRNPSASKRVQQRARSRTCGPPSLLGSDGRMRASHTAITLELRDATKQAHVIREKCGGNVRILTSATQRNGESMQTVRMGTTSNEAHEHGALTSARCKMEASLHCNNQKSARKAKHT